MSETKKGNHEGFLFLNFSTKYLIYIAHFILRNSSATDKSF